MDEKGLGKRLQDARQAAGLTQQQLCQKANLSFSTLAKIERGAIKSPSIFTVRAIAEALNSTVDQLIGSPALAGRSLQKTKSGVSFIYFDINGSLVHFFQQAFTQISIDTGVPADLVEASFWHFNDEACRGILSLDGFNKAMEERLRVTDFDWRRYYLEAVEPVKPLQDLMIWASKHYKVGLLSNIMPGFVQALLDAGKLPNIKYDAIVDSSAIGSIKPENRIYEVAAERAGVPANEILLIDDTRTNLGAAEWLGWHVLLFDDYELNDAVEKLKAAIQPAED